MKDLILIYSFQSSKNQNEDFIPARYQVLYFFSQEGFLDPSLLNELAKLVPSSGVDQLTFLNLDDLKMFALRVGEELKYSQVRLLSVQDYNIGIDGAKDVASFRLIFNKYGELVVNEALIKKKGILGKLFS